MSTEIIKAEHQPAALFRQSTDAASLCKEIVTKTARKIQGRSYVQVEGWQAIAIAHGCVAQSGEVVRIPADESGQGAGYAAMGRVVRMADGLVISQAEGFVGDDEEMWARRPVYARRAMAQTRSISRACRSAFAHVVVMMQAGLETTPAEEMDGVEVQHAVERSQKASEDLAAVLEAMDKAETLEALQAVSKAAAKLPTKDKNEARRRFLARQVAIKTKAQRERDEFVAEYDAADTSPVGDFS